MKTSVMVVILVVVIGASVIFGLTFKVPNDSEDQMNFESPFREEHYSIEITGIKDTYLVGEQYDFSYVISGYGYSCGSKEITFPDQDGDVVGLHSSSSCIAGVPMKEFVFDVQKERGTTYGHVKLKNPGNYNVTVTFDRPSQDFPTTAINEFSVVSSESYNQMNHDTNYYSFAQTIDRVSQCADVGGWWDSEHRVCFNVYDSKNCDMMGGSYLPAAGNEYKCPLDNPNCGGFAAAPPICVFSDSIRTELKEPSTIEKNSATPSSNAQYMGNLDSQEERGEYIGMQVSDPRNQLAQRIENDQNNAILVLVIGIPSFGLMIGFIIWRKRK